MLKVVCHAWLCLQVFVLLFIFVKRQIMRFAMRSRRGPHAPIGHNAPKVRRICFELVYLLWCWFATCSSCCCCESSRVCVFPAVVNLQGLREEIDSRLSKVQEIRFEPRLLEEEDDRLKQGSQISQSRHLLILLPIRCECRCDENVFVFQRLLQLPVQNESSGCHPWLRWEIRCNAQTWVPIVTYHKTESIILTQYFHQQLF